MIKKICMFLFIAILIFSCGKKGDPVFKESKSEKINSKIIITI